MYHKISELLRKILKCFPLFLLFLIQEIVYNITTKIEGGVTMKNKLSQSTQAYKGVTIS